VSFSMRIVRAPIRKVAMRKTILLVLLVVLGSNAAAEWSPVTRNDNLIAYVDLATIRKARNTVTMWSLYDYRTAQQDGFNSGIKYLSSKAQHEFDCKKERARILYFSLYSGNIGAGKVVFSESDPAKWQRIPLGSMIETLWEVACGKR
jgi:hypothetical protein